MVSIVIGSGAGLVNTSKELLGGGGELGQAAMGRAEERLSVNAATGNLVVQDRDEYLVGVGPDVDLLRTYNSQGGWDGDNGDGWRIGYYRRVSGLTGSLNSSGSTIKRTDADGNEAVYAFDSASGRYVSSDGAGQYDTLRYSTGDWTWTDGDTGVTEKYQEASSGSGNFRLTQVADAQGRKVVVGYDAGGLISSLSTFKADSVSADETVALSYTGTQLTSVSTSYLDAGGVSRNRSLTRYEYDSSSGKLAKVITDLTPEDSSIADGTVYAVSYTYDANGRLKTFTQTDGSQATVDYYADGRVKSLTEAAGETLFTYDTDTRKTTVQDALGQVTTLTYDSANRLLEISGSATGGSAIKQRYEYNTAGDLISSTNGRDETTTYEYTSTNAPGALTKRTDAAGNVLERTYLVGGLLESETFYSGPSVASGAPTGSQTTRYFYDPATIAKRQLAYILGPQGQVTRNVYNAQGQLSAQYLHPGAAFTGTASFAALDAWATVTQGSSTQREYTEYFYDLRGQLKEERHYADVPAPAPAATPAYTSARYNYDAFGRLLSKLNHEGFGHTYAYDGLNRLSLVTDAAGATTTYSYDDQNRKTTLKLDNGQYTTQIFDTLGQIVSSETFSATALGLGATSYRYDVLGRLRQVDDPTGQRVWMLYEPSGRKVADIAANGQLTEYAYDAAGRLVQSIAYANLVSAAQLATLADASGNPTTKGLADIRPAADSARDRITTQYYDAAGRLVGVLDAEGYLTETQYDGTSAITGQIRYATAQSVTRLSTTTSSILSTVPTLNRPATDALLDRVLRNVYDASGQLAASIDGEGVLTRWTYDAAGHQRTQQRSAVALSASQRTLSLAELLAIANAANDELRQYLYDNQGRLAAELDAEGNLTEYGYDSVGRLSSTSRYLTQSVKPVTLGVDGKYKLNLLTRENLDTLRPTLGTPLTTGRTYNSRSLLETETAVDGTVTKYLYDSLQRLKSSTRALDTSEATTKRVVYDDWGRIKQEIDGENGVVEYSYDAAGRRASIKDARGNFTYLYYDKFGRQIYAILKDPLQGGEVIETIYSSFSEVAVTVRHSKRLALADCAALSGGLASAALTTKIEALNDATRDNRSEAVFNRRGQIQQAIDALGYKTELSYNAFGEVQTSTAEVDANMVGGRRLTSTLSYDRRGLLVQSTQTAVGGTALSTTTKTSYDAFGRVLSSTDALNQVTGYQYLRNDGQGRKMIVTSAAGGATTVYDAMERAIERIDRSGRTVRMAHDAVARKLTTTTAEGISTVTLYNRLGQTISVTNGENQTTSYSYDSKGNLLTVTDALGNVTRNTYDANNNLYRIESGLAAKASGGPVNDGSAVTTEYSFDAANRVLTQTVDPSGIQLTTSFAYDGQGRKVRVVEGVGTSEETTTEYGFDAKGQLKEFVVDPAGLKLKTVYRYDAQGRKLRVTQGAETPAASSVAYEYDVLGRRTAEIVDPDGLGLKTSYGYDAVGNLTLKRDALNQATRYVYDTANRLEFSIDACGAATSYQYDGEGRATLVRAYASLIALDRVVSTDAALRAALSNAGNAAADQLSLNAYDKDGRLVYAVDAMGGVTQTVYDRAGRVTRTVQSANPIARPNEVSSADAIKLSLQAANTDNAGGMANDRVTRYLYDAAGRQTYVMDALGGIVKTEYDRASRVTKVLQLASSLSDIYNKPGAGVDAWSVYSPSGSGEAVTQVFDAQRNEMVTSLSGQGRSSGYQLNRDASHANWGSTGTQISWDYKYSEDFTFYVSVSTTKGHRYLVYTAGTFAPTGPGAWGEDEFGLGNVVDGQWHTASRDLRSDLQSVEPDAEILAVNGLLVRGSGRIAAVKLNTLDSFTSADQLNQLLQRSDNDRITQYAYDSAGRQRFAVDAEGYVTETRYDGLSREVETRRYQTSAKVSAQVNGPSTNLSAWSAYSGGGAGVSITRVADAQYGSSVIALTGNGTSTGYALTPSAVESVLGGTASVISWDMKYAENFTVYVQVYTKKGTRYLEYHPGAYASGMQYGEYAVHYLGGIDDGKWHGITRDLQADLQALEPDNEFLSITQFLVRGSGRIGNISLSGRDDLKTAAAVAAAIVPGDVVQSTLRSYDKAGRLATETDGNGVVTRFDYDAAGRVTDKTEAYGRSEARVTHSVYDAAGRLVEETMAYGRSEASTSRFAYDALGRLASALDARGWALANGNGAWERAERIRLGYAEDLAANAQVQRDALRDAYTTRYIYDDTNRRTQVIDALGGTTTTQCDAFGNTVQVTDARGYASKSWYDALNRLVQSVDAEGYLSQNQYDGLGNLTDTLKVNARVQGSLDLAKPVQLLSAAPSDGSAYVLLNAALDARSHQEYDRLGQLLWTRDAEGNVEGSLAALSVFGQRLSVVNKLGGLASFTYDKLGRILTETLPVTSTNASGVVAKDDTGTILLVVNEYQYDSRGNRILSIEAKGLAEQRTTEMRYDGANQLTHRIGMSYTAEDAAGITSTVIPADFFRYDALGNLVEQISHGQLQANGSTVAGGKRSVAYYNALGLKRLEMSADRALTSFSYDPAGNAAVQTTFATRVVEGATVDPAGSAPSVATTMNDRTLRTRYDALGRKIELALDNLHVWDSSSPTLVISGLTPTRTILQTLRYDATGNLTERVDGRGNSSFEYFDGIGRRLLSIDAGGAAIAWEYGRASKVATQETRYAATLHLGYSRQANQLSGRDATNDPAQLLPLIAGMLLPTGEKNRVTQYKLDLLDRVLEKSVLDAAQDYIDATGKRVTKAASAITQYSYNGLGAMTQVRELALELSNGIQQWEVTDIGYDALGREIHREAPGYVDYEGATVRPTTDIQYDGLGNISRRIQRGKDGTVETDDRITRSGYDKNGLLIKTTDASGAVTLYAIDNLGQVSRRISVGVHRSDASTRDLVKTYQYDAAGRITVETDVETGEVRKTRFNAFGEISAKGLGNGWEEFAEYSTLGKVVKTNAGDGAIKFYVQDANGNTTRELRGNGDSSVDLKAMTLEQASVSNKVFYRVSVFNSRNLLTRTIDPKIDTLKSSVTMSDLYSQAWVPTWSPPSTTSVNAELLSDGNPDVKDDAVIRFTAPATANPYSAFYVAVLDQPPGELLSHPAPNISYEAIGPDGYVERSFASLKGQGQKYIQYGAWMDYDGGAVLMSASAKITVTENQSDPSKCDIQFEQLPRLNRDWSVGCVFLPQDPSRAALGLDTHYDYELSEGGVILQNGIVTSFSNNPSAASISLYWLHGNPSRYENLVPQSGVRTLTLKYSTSAFGGGSYTATVRVYSDGMVTTSGNPDPAAIPVNFTIRGRNIPRALLDYGGTMVEMVGQYSPPSGLSPGYTTFSFDARNLVSANGLYDYTLTPLSAAGNPMLDESGRPLLQVGRIKIDPSGSTPPQVLQLITVLNTSANVTISRRQEFNAFGEVIEERDERVADRMKAALGTSTLTAGQLAAARTTLQYNTLGQLVKKIDPETWVTASNGYRYRDRPTTVFGYDLLGRHTTTIDANGNLSRVQQAAGARGRDGATLREFDAAGGRADDFNATGGGVTQYERDVFGDVRRVTDAANHVVLQDYDAMGRLVTVTRKDVKRVNSYGTTLAAVDLRDSYAYDELGQRIRFTNALNGSSITTDYDGLGRVTKTVTAQGFATTYHYSLRYVGATGVVAMAGAVSDGAASTTSGGYVKTTTQADGRTLVDRIEYFGHVTSHTDLSGTFTTTFSYNSAGQLAKQSSTVHSGQTSAAEIEYSYYANGYISSLTDITEGVMSEYAYDDAGNRVSEGYFRFTRSGTTTTKTESLQNNVITYDELNRIVRVKDDNLFTINYEFDAVGNRRMVDSVYKDGQAGLWDRQTYWYDYDSRNRFVITKGRLSSTSSDTSDIDRFAKAARGTSKTDTSVWVEAGTDGILVGYDKLSQRRSASYVFNGTTVNEEYGYSDDGYLQTTKQNGVLKTTRELDALGRTTLSRDLANSQTTTSYYDKDNRLTSQGYVDGLDNTKSYTLDYAYYNDQTDTSSSISGSGALAKTTLKPNTAGTDSTKYTFTSYTYEYWDGAQQKQITKVAPGVAAGNTYFYYSAAGHLRRNYDSVASVDNTYVTFANGQVLTRTRNGSRHHYFYYADGNRIGDVSDTPDDVYRVSYAEQLAAKDAARSGSSKRSYYRDTSYAVWATEDENGDYVRGGRQIIHQGASTADFDQNYEPINDNYPGAAASSYTVRSDAESLSGIAQSLWGDQAMWYLIAESNGLQAGSALKAGQLLVIPNKVTNIHNNSQTWRPYNAGEAIGRSDPTLPTPPPPAQKGCGGIGTLIMVAVAVVATIYTAGAAAGVLANGASIAAGTVGVAGAGGASVWAAGVAALSGGLGAGFAGAAMASAAIGAAVGSIASQGVGLAIGQVDSFSWKAVGQAALGGAITAGVGSFASGALANQASSWAAAGRAAIGTGVNLALHNDWSWRDVMISAVSAGAGSAVGSQLGAPGSFARQFGGGLAGGLTARSLTSGNRASYATVFASTLGNAIGESLAAPSSSPSRPLTFEEDRAARQRALDPNGFGGLPRGTGSSPTFDSSDMPMQGLALGEAALARLGVTGSDSARSVQVKADPVVYRDGPFLPIQPGIYNFESGVNRHDVWQATWTNYPNNVVLRGAEGETILPSRFLTTKRDMGAAAQGIVNERLAQSTPSSEPSTFWGAYGSSMGAVASSAWSGVKNFAYDAWSGKPRWAEAGIQARSSIFRDSDRMGFGNALLLRGVEGTLAPWQLLGSLSGSTVGTGTALWRGDMAGAGRNAATATLDTIAIGGMVLGGRAGVSGRTSFALGEGVGERYLGLLNRNAEPLTATQMAEARSYAMQLGLPEDRLQFFTHGGAHQRSAYSDLFDTVFLGPDLMPGVGEGLAANSRISSRGLLAHEIVGHRETTLAGRAFEAGSLYDEVQASWRAARLAPDLTPADRMLLLRDAVERVHGEGLRVKDLDKSIFWFGRPQ